MIPFEEKTVKYYIETESERLYGKTNPETWHFWEHRYVVLRDFIPKEIRKFAMDTWKTMEAQPHNFMNGDGMKREGDIINRSPKDTLGKSVGGHSSPMGVAMGRWMQEALEKRLDISLRETYTYSRKYDRGAYLKAHVDRPSCEISTTYCLDYQSDDGEPWKIWVQNDENYVGSPCMEEVFQISQGVRPSQRIAKPLKLYPGDVLVYQGPNVIHFRDKFVGDFSYHMFSHFNNLDGGLKDYCFAEDYVLKTGGSTPYNASNRSILEFDGRPNRYVESGHDEGMSRMMNDFSENFEKLPREEKIDLVNNFAREGKPVRVEE